MQLLVHLTGMQICRWCGWLQHDDVIKWKHFPRYWPFARGIDRLPFCSWRGLVWGVIRTKPLWCHYDEAPCMTRPHLDLANSGSGCFSTQCCFEITHVFFPRWPPVIRKWSKYQHQNLSFALKISFQVKILEKCHADLKLEWRCNMNIDKVGNVLHLRFT